MKKNYFITTLLITIISTSKAQTVLPSVTIGTQIWQSTNLDVTTYSDGTPIPQVTSSSAWANLTTGAWCYYNNDSANNAVYGKLYNWYAVAGIYDAPSLANPVLRKNLAPTGWHVPTDTEWSTLMNSVDPNSNGGLYSPNAAGGPLKEAGSTHWWAPNTAATNSSGFTGLPEGSRSSGGSFGDIQNYGEWWTSSEYDTTIAWCRFLYSNYSSATRNNYAKSYGFSVRCLSNQSLNLPNSNLKPISIYPNPTNSLLHISINDVIVVKKVTIVDITGKIVLEQTENINSINVEKLAKGVYIITAYADDKKYEEKFVKE